jgi:hypothetical protein
LGVRQRVISVCGLAGNGMQGSGKKCDCEFAHFFFSRSSCMIAS